MHKDFCLGVTWGLPQNLVGMYEIELGTEGSRRILTYWAKETAASSVPALCSLCSIFCLPLPAGTSCLYPQTAGSPDLNKATWKVLLLCSARDSGQSGLSEMLVLLTGESVMPEPELGPREYQWASLGSWGSGLGDIGSVWLAPRGQFDSGG